MSKSRINRPDAKQLFLDGDGRGAKAGESWTGGQAKQLEERLIFTVPLYISKQKLESSSHEFPCLETKHWGCRALGSLLIVKSNYICVAMSQLGVFDTLEHPGTNQYI